MSIKKAFEYLDKPMTREEAIELAGQMTEEAPITVFVYSLDNGEDRSFYITRDETYFQSDEFIAFEGEVLAEFYDGYEC